MLQTKPGKHITSNLASAPSQRFIINRSVQCSDWPKFKLRWCYVFSRFLLDKTSFQMVRQVLVDMLIRSQYKCPPWPATITGSPCPPWPATITGSPSSCPSASPVSWPAPCLPWSSASPSWRPSSASGCPQTSSQSRRCPWSSCSPPRTVEGLCRASQCRTWGRCTRCPPPLLGTRRHQCRNEDTERYDGICV